MLRLITNRPYGGTITPGGMTVCGLPGVSSSILQPPISSGASLELTISTHSGPLAGAGMNSLMMAVGAALTNVGATTIIMIRARAIDPGAIQRIPPPAAHKNRHANTATGARFTKDGRSSPPALVHWAADNGTGILQEHRICLRNVCRCGIIITAAAQRSRSLNV